MTFDDVDAGPMSGMLELPGVGYTITGGGDVDALKVVIRFTDEAQSMLAERFGCAATTEAVKDAILAGMGHIFGSDVVSCLFWREGSDR